MVSYAEGIPILSALFEAASAIGTVGLTVGITPELTIASKVILIALMYFGRTGALTLLYSIWGNRKEDIAEVPEGRITIG